ncbi:MAG: 16S rRNA (cytosine(1402)-N(4))-methyltransferase RsmH [Desulfobacterales bacterium]|jgi:16S rRNA (cytosine1402-N4)-methyltransferase|nr:16S rRNA (cytosine(1402)-N(4))-methyltransferase RsmH [Desulfobacteraceae bacterium]MBT4363519.1 16S rRNA (cytosine(1402)-N(4))-methyltransferase RsmH [Desulfobacteraceae bacterium]MBT7085259.1 16S rRNA (cytosine(1402)-N(4))-methyltransferase RsmH [Desulfobacterales bacterium]MBT7696027.1 16S rRNA (cytosine(1402)-N(4))-methyltransferase RsmH [Desulfobacterales bacterium]
MTYTHIPVMPAEVTEYMNLMPGKIYVDCTMGGAGHSEIIVKNIIPDGIMIGIDQDADAIENARKILKKYKTNIRLFHKNFIYLPEILSQLNIDSVDGILLDLGLSLHHFEESGRGFSFKKDEPLDMRMNTQSDTMAKDIINNSQEKELAKIFFEFGEERRSRLIARNIVRERENNPIRTSRQLADIILNSLPKKALYNQKIHPATRVFMALRIAVNSELERLDFFMKKVADLLNPGGRLCVISFHSLEDRIVKHSIRAMEHVCSCPPDFPECVCGNKKIFRSLFRKGLTPTEEEIERNPMSRSARLRIAERL